MEKSMMSIIGATNKATILNKKVVAPFKVGDLVDYQNFHYLNGVETCNSIGTVITVTDDSIEVDASMSGETEIFTFSFDDVVKVGE